VSEGDSASPEQPPDDTHPNDRDDPEAEPADRAHTIRLVDIVPAALAVIGVVLGILADTLGVAHVSRFALAAALTPIVISSVSCSMALAPTPRRPLYLVISLASLVALIVGVTIYHELEGTSSERAYEFTPRTGDETAGVPLSGEPGGNPIRLNEQNGAIGGLYGGHSYSFSCSSTAPDGSSWLRLYRTSYWAPSVLLRPRQGEGAAIPRCQS